MGIIASGMSRNDKIPIAILSSFPAWLYTKEVPKRDGRYAVWLAALHEGLKQQNDFDVHWITLSKGLKKPVHIDISNQHVHVLPRISRAISQHSLYVVERFRVARALSVIKPELVHSWGTEDCYGLCARDFKGVRLHSVQGALKAYVGSADFPWFVKVQSMYEPWVWKSMRHITTESPWAADRVKEIVPSAEPILWEYAVEERFFHMERNLAPVPQCLYSGTDIPIKNVGFLIDAFSDPRLAHVQLKLAGVPAESLSKFTPNIIPLGLVGREEMVKLLSETWALVHMSLGDTGPTIVKEARVAGVPVILSDRCGSVQHVDDGKSGYILSTDDREGFIRAVLKVTENAETARKMGEHGRDICRDRLSSATMLQHLLDIYWRLLRDEWATRSEFWD